MEYKPFWNKDTMETILVPIACNPPDFFTEFEPPFHNNRIESCEFRNERWEITSKSAMEQLRGERTRRLETTDMWALSDRTMTDAQKAYRQELRDLPSQFVDSPPQLDEFGQLTGVDWPKIEK
jgi:hypothetical protein